MGFIKAAASAVSGTFADQWKEVIEAGNMPRSMVFKKGELIRQGQNTKKTEDIITNGSVVHVYDNQFAMLVDGGKIVDYTAEPGYFTISNSSAPSYFAGQFADSFKDAWNRFTAGGQPTGKQQVFFINLQEITDITFGTPMPLDYFDAFYNAELQVGANGYYSVKIVNPLQFYAECIPKGVNSVDYNDISGPYTSRFLEEFGGAFGEIAEDFRMEVESGATRTTFKAFLQGHKGQGRLSEIMRTALDEDWTQKRGFEIFDVAIRGFKFTEESQKIVNTRNSGAALSDPTIARGYMVSHMGEAMTTAAGNANGADNGFIAMGLGGNLMGGVMNGFGMNQQPQQYPQQQYGQQQYGQPQYNQAPQTAGGVAAAAMAGAAAGAWTCACGASNTGKFCSNCGQPQPAPAPAAGWTCTCGAVNTGKFCSNCGQPQPVASADWTCACGTVNTGKFCSNCGKPRA